MQVSKGVIFATASAFMLLLAVVAFLLGRESGRGKMPMVAAPPIPTIPTPMPAPPPPAVADPNPVVPAIPPLPDKAPADAAAIVQYFATVEAIQVNAGGNGSDPQEFAQKLLAGAMSGDTSGFDGLIKEAEAGEQKARALTPPPSCTAYHREFLEFLGQTNRMLRTVRDALKKNDATKLASLGAEANLLKTRAESLNEKAKAIKASAGISN